MQIFVHGRHGTIPGAIYGAGGVALGLLIGNALRSGVQWIVPLSKVCSNDESDRQDLNSSTS
jgi:hypothetical protein